MKKKIATIVGTRPEIIRLSCIIEQLDKYFNHVLINTNQNWDFKLNEIFFKEMDIRKPDYILDIIGSNVCNTIGNIISHTYSLLEELEPDCVLILGDTNSGLSAISAKKLKIPIFHLEAGNRCFDENVPEEINRRIIDHISDINMAYTEHARKNLLSEGIHTSKILVVGSPMFEVYNKYKSNIENSDILTKLNLVTNEYFLLSCHREENVDNKINLSKLINIINNVAEKYNKPIIFSCHPRTKKNIKNIQFHELIKIMEPFGYFDYCKLQKNALCVLSDSGTLSEEACILNFKGVLIRTSTERPESLENGNIILGGIDTNILNSIEIIVKTEIQNIPIEYLNEKVSIKIIRNIMSLIDKKSKLFS